MKLSYDDKERLAIYKSEIKRLRQNIEKFKRLKPNIEQTDINYSESIQKMTDLLKQYIMAAKILGLEGDFDE